MPDPRHPAERNSTTRGKRICPWCGRRCTLRKGAFPSHPHPHIKARLCPGAGKPYISKRRRIPTGINLLIPFTDGGMP